MCGRVRAINPAQSQLTLRLGGGVWVGAWGSTMLFRVGKSKEIEGSVETNSFSVNGLDLEWENGEC
jgi:hypothetical protein